MAIGINISSSNTCSVEQGKPDIYNFKVVEQYSAGEFHALKVPYPNSSNYEGNKILVFKDTDQVKEALEKGELDPHFLETSSLLARFSPTQEGRELAKKLVLDASKEKRVVVPRNS